MTKSQTIAADVSALIRSRCPLLWIVTREEARVERYLVEAAAAAKYGVRTWDVGVGVLEADGSVPSPRIGSPDPGESLDAIAERSIGRPNPEKIDRCVWIMRDLPVWLAGMPGASVNRKLRNLARNLPGTRRDWAQAIIVLTPSADVPPELAGHATIINWPLPDREEIEAILDAAIDALPDDMRGSAAPNGQRAAAIDAAVGLSGEEAAACYAKSIVQYRKIDPAAVAQEKRRVITQGGLEWYDPLPGGLDAVGGLDLLKVWLKARSSAYTPEARAYGLPAPKGAFLVGVPGCGKSLLSKAIATAWKVPLLRLDLNALKGKFVGESEGNIRKAFAIIEAIGRCVVWVDEIEKALQGATSGSSDGGVSSDALGTFLSWMQERKGESFIIATANDVEALPPELLRKGRFDEVWFVDLPNQEEREAVLLASLKTFGREKTIENYRLVAQACAGFTGSEIAALVPDALYAAFAEGAREICERDLLDAAKTVVPLSKTAEQKITKLREWAVGKARRATALEVVDAARNAVRQVDIG